MDRILVLFRSHFGTFVDRILVVFVVHFGSHFSAIVLLGYRAQFLGIAIFGIADRIIVPPIF